MDRLAEECPDCVSAVWEVRGRQQESLRETGTPTSSWLTVKAGMSKREAAGFLHQAQELAAHPEVADAATAGRISVNQARAIHTVLGGLDGLSDDQQAQAEGLLLDLAGTMDTDRLAKAAPQVLAAVAPKQAEENLENRLQRQAEAAQRNRSLVFGRDGNGSITFSGSLPLVDGEAWIAILDAYTESRHRSALEERDPLATSLTPQQRRADALVAMVINHQRGKRLVTPEIRAALDLRDGGCIFPGCEARACTCEAHHVVPWSAGGTTALCNLCLLCHHHHALLEPARYGTRDQWEVRIAEDDVPEVIPPRRCDPQRRPIRHARFESRALARTA